jgi:predicted amidohydrolase
VEPVKVACCQFRPAPGDVPANLRRMRDLAGDAAREGARIVLFSELATTGYLPPERIPPLAEPLSGPAVSELARVAASLRVVLAFGLAERTADGRLHNSLVYLGAGGERAGLYRKVHLWDTERRWAVPGEGSTVVECAGWRTGGWICYDTRFPELARAQAAAGADLALVATAWLGPGDEWELAMRARALDNAIYVAGADTVDSAIGCHGRSLIVDPHGRVIARARLDEDCVITAEIDPQEMARQRERVPLLRDLRPEAYTAVTT